MIRSDKDRPSSRFLQDESNQQFNRITSSIIFQSVTQRIPNVEVRTRTGQQTIDNILRERRHAWTCLPYGPPAHTTASTVLAGTRIQERTRSTTTELEKHSQQRPTKDGVYMGGSRGGSSSQTRMASECGPMYPVGCGMNQGQGHTK